MFQRFSCGHIRTCGLWKDDFVFTVSGLCPVCDVKNRDRLKPTTRLVTKGERIMVIRKVQQK